MPLKRFRKLTDNNNMLILIGVCWVVVCLIALGAFYVWNDPYPVSLP